MRRMMVGMWVFAIAMGLLYGKVMAFNPVDLTRLQQTNSCAYCNLSGVHLLGADLTNADLYHSNLTGANLTRAILSNAVWTDGSVCELGSIGKCNKK